MRRQSRKCSVSRCVNLHNRGKSNGGTYQTFRFTTAQGEAFFGAREATIFSKRGSPREESHSESRRRSPYDGPHGILLTTSNCSKARSFSPVSA